MENWKRYYEEYYCKVLIEKFCPECSFAKSEKPDFVDHKNHIGLEITIAQVGNAYNNSLIYAENENGNRRDYEKTKQNLSESGLYTPCGYFQMNDGNPIESMKKGLKKKLELLNSTFEVLENNWLAFYFEPPMNDYQIPSYFEDFDLIQKGYVKCFDKIIVCGSEFVIYDKKEKRCHKKSFDSESQVALAIKAKTVAMADNSD